MKKFLSLILALTMAAGLAACGSGQTPSASQETDEPPSSAVEPSNPDSSQPDALDAPASDADTEGKSLVVYFSLPETNDPNNMTQEEENSAVVIDGEVLGNTQYVAYIIQENTGADIFRIEAEIPYPLDHDTLVDQAAEEQDCNARPAIADHVDNMDDYDTIFLGYPNWWGDMPMILYTFLEEYDLSGKTIVPFNTHGGSGFSNTIQTIAELQPGADVLEDGFTVSRNNVAEAESDVVSWLDEHGFTAAN